MVQKQARKIAEEYRAATQRAVDECLKSIHLIMVVPHAAGPSILRVVETLTVRIREETLEMARQVLHNIAY